LSEVTGYGVFRVQSPEAGAAPIDALRRHSSQQQTAMYFAKLPCTSVAALTRFTAAGMSPVDVSITLQRSGAAADNNTGADIISSRNRSAPADIQVVRRRPAHTSQLLEIASRVFRYSRFHLDPAIPDSVADEMRRAWVQSYIDGDRGDQLLVAERGGEVLGFLAAMRATGADGQDVAVLDLMAVSTPRCGVGELLVRSFIAEYSPCAELGVGTQAANATAIRLYERCGFRFSHAEYVLHMHQAGKECK